MVNNPYSELGAVSIMKEYNASTSPDPEKWLALDEAVRLELLIEFVNNYENSIEEDAKRIHAAIHVIVENQLAQNTEPTKETYNRLKRQGLERHEIIHAIGAVISEKISKPCCPGILIQLNLSIRFMLERLRSSVIV